MAKTKKADPLKPSASVLSKLGSAIVHAQESLSPDGRPVDRQEFEQILKDPEVDEWMEGMTKLALLPVLRGPGGTR